MKQIAWDMVGQYVESMYTGYVGYGICETRCADSWYEALQKQSVLYAEAARYMPTDQENDFAIASEMCDKAIALWDELKKLAHKEAEIIEQIKEQLPQWTSNQYALTYFDDFGDGHDPNVWLDW